MKQHLPLGRDSSRPARPLLAALGLLALILGVLITLSSGLPGGGHAGAQAGSGPAGNWYFRSGQWKADAHTLVAAAKWYLERDPLPLSNSNAPFGTVTSTLPRLDSATVRPAV